jgi:hypothetical protein
MFIFLYVFKGNNISILYNKELMAEAAEVNHILVVQGDIACRAASKALLYVQKPF